MMTRALRCPGLRQCLGLFQHRLSRLLLLVRWVLVAAQQRLHHHPNLGAHRFSLGPVDVTDMHSLY
jgi:hypothetical protein